MKHELVTITFPIGTGPDGMRPEYHIMHFDSPIIPSPPQHPSKGNFKSEATKKVKFNKRPQNRESRANASSFIKKER